MVLNAAVQLLGEAEELKQKILKFKSGTSMLQDRNLWTTQQQLQKVYQKVLMLDLDYALDKKVEQDLWNVGFKQQIEALQAISKDRKNPSRSEGQAMLSWVLQAAAGFYLCLLHQICTTFKLDLPFRRRASLLGCVEGWAGGAGARPAAAAARYIAQHCLVHLGDLARYRHQLRVAHTFYRHAVVVWAVSGQPYNQLALVAWRRGRRLAALYWHVRAALVQAPFPPANANLARTLSAAAAAAGERDNKEAPVLPGITGEGRVTSQAVARPLDAHGHVSQLIRVAHLLHTLEDLDTAARLVTSLNSSLSALIATESFESMTLIKMSCIIIWLVHSSTEQLTLSEASLSEGEAEGARLAQELAAGHALAHLLPAYTTPKPPSAALPPVKVWLQWLASHPQVLSGPAFVSRPQFWAALAHNLNALSAQLDGFRAEQYETLPLPEDEELHGFLPLEAALAGLKFADHATWDTYGDRIPDFKEDGASGDEKDDDGSDTESFPAEVRQLSLSTEPGLESRVRASRLVRLGRTLALLRPDMLTVQTEDERTVFSASCQGGEQLSEALAELSLAASGQRVEDDDADVLDDLDESDDEKPMPPPPVVISEADFREKIIEKRVGILKPQGSLERAREERAMANSTQDDQEAETTDESSKGAESKKEANRKPRMNVAMAAIMRKQEETNKQVKFVSPPPTPDSTADSTDTISSSKEPEKTKIMQPKAIKSLANLPIGRKTGGILSLKDKSAGYPHLVNTEPEPTKKPEKEEKKEAKPNQTHQNKRQDIPPNNWGNNSQNTPMQPPYSDTSRFNLAHKNYGIQNTGLNYSPNYQSHSNQGIRLPVVNPKEIDVRTAALQKQSARQDLYQDPHRFGNQNYQMSGDKKNFLNDLPPRFANQYRHWQNSQENHFNPQQNQFKNDNYQMQNNPVFTNNQPQAARSNWTMNQPVQENYPPPWWKPENPPNFNTNFATPMNMQPNFYTPHMANASNAFTNMPPPTYNQMQNQNVAQPKIDFNAISPNYLRSNLAPPQLNPLQSLVSSQNFNSGLNSFSYPNNTVSYDPSMYPQFNKLGYQCPQMKPPDKPLSNYSQSNDLSDMSGLNFGANVLGDMQHPESNAMEQMGKMTEGSGESQANTYSLFSGAQENNSWGSAQVPPQQSLWSGPGPSPLERLLEQQKTMKHSPSEPQ